MSKIAIVIRFVCVPYCLYFKPLLFYSSVNHEDSTAVQLFFTHHVALSHSAKNETAGNFAVKKKVL